MKAWIIDRICDLRDESQPLSQVNLPVPEVKEGELLIKVSACGVCHTEIDEIEGRTPPPVLPVVPGHQVVGRVEESSGNTMMQGSRVGVAWIYSACGHCAYCVSGNENLCHSFRATGRDVNGGYAEYMVVPEKFAYPIPDYFSDIEAAPLLCAGAVGYRSVSLCHRYEKQKIGLTGFGASAHLVLKMIQYRHPEWEVYVFARNHEERAFARELGARWAGDTTDVPPVKLDSVIDTTPAWKPVIAALDVLKPGGRLVINAIGKEDSDKDMLLHIDYARHLWMEKEIKSVANVTGNDVRQFLQLAADMKFKPEVEVYPFDDANRAILDIRNRRIKGAKVLAVQ